MNLVNRAVNIVEEYDYFNFARNLIVDNPEIHDFMKQDDEKIKLILGQEFYQQYFPQIQSKVITKQLALELALRALEHLKQVYHLNILLNLNQSKIQ